MQSRLGSFIESCTNIAIGYGVALLAQAAIFPLYGIHVAPHEHMTIGAMFTAVSLLRSFALRRFFNWLGVHHG